MVMAITGTWSFSSWERKKSENMWPCASPLDVIAVPLAELDRCLFEHVWCIVLAAEWYAAMSAIVVVRIYMHTQASLHGSKASMPYCLYKFHILHMQIYLHNIWLHPLKEIKLMRILRRV